MGVYLDQKNIQIDLHMRKAIALGERVRGEEYATKDLLGKIYIFYYYISILKLRRFYLVGV